MLDRCLPGDVICRSDGITSFQRKAKVQKGATDKGMPIPTFLSLYKLNRPKGGF